MKEEMDSELRGLLQRGAPGFDAPEGTQQRAFERLLTALPPGALVSLPESKSAAPSTGGATLPANPPFVAALKAFGPMFLTFLAGAGVGAAVTRSTSAPTVVYVQPSAQSPSTPLAPSAESLAPAVDTSAPDEVVGPSAPPPKRVVAPDASSSSSRSALNAERALLDRGRMAFARGDAAACLGLLDEHRARYPRGVLGEERDALAIRALVALGRTSEAHTLASKFEQSYPTSLMLPAVKAALGESSSAN